MTNVTPSLTSLADIRLLHPSGQFEVTAKQYMLTMGLHFDMLSNAIPNLDFAQPIVYISNVPAIRATNSSANKLTEVESKRFNEIDQQLDLLGKPDGGEPAAVDQGAIDTAKAVLLRIKGSDFSPPEVSWLSEEAVVMLWATGETKYALTVTDGEVGYVVRRATRTIRRLHGIPALDLEIKRLR